MKLLIIRFSSLGDIAQCLQVPHAVKAQSPEAQIHWVTRKDFARFVEINKDIECVHILDRNTGIKGLIKLAVKLRRMNFTHIYDAHNNLRSHLLCILLRSFNWKRSFFYRRSKQRWNRLLLFKFRINRFPKPFRGMISFLQPIAKIIPSLSASIHVLPNVATQKDTVPQKNTASKQNTGSLPEITNDNYVIIAPSAAWQLKRWPLSYWKELISLTAPYRFIVLGGPDDTYAESLAEVDPSRVTSLIGKLNWIETTQLIAFSRLVISGDTGVLHIADYLNIPSIGIIGPTAFGYPSRPHSKVLEIDLYCKPCSKDGRGRCHNETYKKCLKSIPPQTVAKECHKILKGSLSSHSIGDLP